MTGIDQPTYSPIRKFNHWLSAVFIFGLLISGLWMVELDYYSEWYQRAPELHQSWGAVFIAIFFFNSGWRIASRVPGQISAHKSWEVFLANSVQLLLFLLVFLMLCSGFLIVTADYRGVEVFDWFQIPALFSPFEEQADLASNIHQVCAYLIIFLIFLHILGALKHHFLDKDDTLKNIL